MKHRNKPSLSSSVATADRLSAQPDLRPESLTSRPRAAGTPSLPKPSLASVEDRGRIRFGGGFKLKSR
jgi:hypothetical protein